MEKQTTVLLGDVEACTARIKSANKEFSRQFVEWILVVGAELRSAQNALAVRKLGFEKWCKDEFGWTKQQCHYLMNAKETIELLTSTTVDVKALPTNEAQCRELSIVPKGELVGFWQKVVDQAERKNSDVTAKMIRQATEPYRIAKAASVEEADRLIEEDEFSSLVCRLLDRLDSEIKKWPLRYRANVCRQILFFASDEGKFWESEWKCYTRRHEGQQK